MWKFGANHRSRWWRGSISKLTVASSPTGMLSKSLANFYRYCSKLGSFSCNCSSKYVAIEGTDRWILFKFGTYLCLWWWRGSNIIEVKIISNLHALQISLKLLLRGGCHKLKSLIHVNIARNLRQLKYQHIKWS